jgi:hypothetical protein
VHELELAETALTWCSMPKVIGSAGVRSASAFSWSAVLDKLLRRAPK